MAQALLEERRRRVRCEGKGIGGRSRWRGGASQNCGELIEPHSVLAR
jgi:hypothetical protein